MTRTSRLEWETDISTSPSVGKQTCAVARCRRDASTRVALAMGGAQQQVPMCGPHATSWSASPPYP